jgi:hypothetical protein
MRATFYANQRPEWFRRTDFSSPPSWPVPPKSASALLVHRGKPEPASRYIVVARSKDEKGSALLKADLLAYECVIKEVGGDWHITAKTKSELDALVQLLQRRRIHGVLKRLPIK